MASAYRDMAKALAGRPETGWRASFRPLRSRPNQRRRVAIPREALAGADDAKAAADAWALECERLCRLLERRASPDPELIDRAEAHRAISPEDAQALRDALPPNLVAPKIPGLLDMALEHPSAKREAQNNPSDYRRHVRELGEFIEWSGVDRVENVRLSLVLAWVEEMRRRGLSWHGRRHRLLYLRWACFWAAEYGIGDALGRVPLDKEEERAEIDAWSPRELIAAAKRFRADADWRALAALGLGGFAGLRSSEIIRARCGDLAEGSIRVGRRERKTPASRRILPLPATAAGWIAEAIQGRPDDAPIIVPVTGHGRLKLAGFSPATFSAWLIPRLAEATGRRLPAKCLRKSFASMIAERGAGKREVDGYLGHGPRDTAGHHYLLKIRERQLRPVADDLEEMLREAGVSPGPSHP